jgi:hypothetical protein
VACLIVFLLHFIMHCVFLIRPIIAINQPILYCLWGIYLLLTLVVIVDYCILTCGDPVDNLLHHPEQV